MSMLRDTCYGPVLGVDDRSATGTYHWKGVPFAQPPVGALRWRAPQPPAPWREPRPALAFAPASVQFGSIFGPGRNNTWDESIGTSLGQAVGSEDCLYLNIWRPAGDQDNLPVIYFIQGGSNVFGYSADPIYDGAALARVANAVVVTGNYRVGLFGWLNLDALKTGSDPAEDSGNFGILDQIATLRFIRDNIAAFGGDPGQVTLMGQSSGAVNGYALLTSPLLATEPLFHRAILMSGGLALPEELPPGSIATLQPEAYSRRQGQALLEALLIADGLASDAVGAAAYAAARTPAELAEYLRAQTPSAIFRQLLTRLAMAGLLTTSHIPDGRVVAASPIAAIRAGNYRKVPLLLSTTKDEATLFPGFLALAPALGGVPGLTVTEAERFRLMHDFDGDAPPSLAASDLINPAYLPVDAPGTGYHARMARLNELFFLALRDAMVQALSPQQSDIWYFRFDWDLEPEPWDTIFGACHVFDLPFVFGTFGPSALAQVMNSKANEGGRLALSAAMMASVAAFARTGDPNHAGLGLTWPVWPATLVFDATRTDKAISLR